MYLMEVNSKTSLKKINVQFKEKINLGHTVMAYYKSTF